jgi:hypothetical protein
MSTSAFEQMVAQIGEGLLDGLSPEDEAKARQSLERVVNSWLEQNDGDFALALRHSAPLLRERVLAVPLEQRERAIAAEAVGARIELLSGRTMILALSIIKGEEPAGAKEEGQRLEDELVALSAEARALPPKLIAPWLDYLSEAAMEAHYIIHRKATSLRLGHYMSAGKKKSPEVFSPDWDALFSAEDVDNARRLVDEIMQFADDPEEAQDIIRDLFAAPLTKAARITQLEVGASLAKLEPLADDAFALAQQAMAFPSDERPLEFHRKARLVALELALIDARLSRVKKEIPDEVHAVVATARLEAEFAMSGGPVPPRLRG